MAAVLVQIDGYDPVAGAAVSLYASNSDDERVCGLNGQLWYPVLARLPQLRYDLFDGAFTARIETPSSALALGTEAWPNFGRYTLADARLRIWTGEPGDAWGAYVLRFDGRVTAQPRVANGAADIPFAVDDRWLDAPLLTTYAGTGGAEGDAAWKGQPKPLAIGAPRYVPARMIDSVNNVVQLSAYGAIEDVEYAMERLQRFGASAGDFASYAALVAATIAPGSWATSKAAGLVRHGAPPAGRLSYQVKGDKGGPDGWVRKPGAVIKRLALLAGGAGKVDTASLAALDISRPWNISLYAGQQITARDLIQRIAASVNAVAGVDWVGKLFVAPVAIGASSLTLDATGASLPPTTSVEQLEMGAPWWKLAIGAEPTWDVHPYSDVAFTAVLVDRGDFNPAEVYREGHIVKDQDVSWIYINSTPSSNAPPTLPTTVNGWWRAMLNKPAQLTLKSDVQQFKFNAAGVLSPGSQVVTFTAERQNNAGTLSWAATAYDSAGASLGTVPLRTTAGGTTAATTQTTVYLQSGVLPASFAQVIVVATSGAPDNVGDSKSILRVQDGASAKLVVLISDKQQFTADGTGALSPATQSIKIDMLRQNTAAGQNPSWAATAYNSAGASLGAVTLRTTSAGTTAATTETTVYLQSAVLPAGTTQVIVTGTCDGLPDTLSITKTSDGAPARSLIIVSDVQQLTYGPSGVLAPTTQVVTITAQRQNNTGTLSWSAAAFNSAGASLGAVTLRTTAGGTTTATNQATVYLQSGVLPAGTAKVVVTATSGSPDNVSDSLSIVKVQDGQSGTNYVNDNPRFADFPTSPGIPTRWTNSSNGTGTKVAGESGGSNGYQLDAAAGAGAQIEQDIGSTTQQSVVQNQFLVVDAEVRAVNAGDLAGAGVRVRILNSAGSVVQTLLLDFDADRDTLNAVNSGGGAAGVVYRFKKLFKVTAATAFFYRFTIANHNTDFGSIAAANSLIWYLAGVRPPTMAELLTYPGSGVRLGDARQMPAITSAGARWKFTGSISYSATPTSATISVTAGSVLMGGVTLSLNAMSATVSGTSGSTVTYQLYIDNPDFAGGAQTLVATANGDAVYGGDGRMWVGACTVTFPASGTGTGSGSTGTGVGPRPSIGGGDIP